MKAVPWPACCSSTASTGPTMAKAVTSSVVAAPRRQTRASPEPPRHGCCAIRSRTSRW